MPTTIKAENFDGVTAPAFPSGWTTSGLDNTIITGTTQALSSPNSAISPDANDNRSGGYWPTKDGNGGNAQVSMSFRFEGSLTPTGGASQNVVVICRMVNAYADRYQAALNASSSSLHLQVFVGGANTFLVVGQAATFATGIWYTMRLKCDGDNISVRIQRSSDSNYLTSSNTWQAGATDCMAVTDSTSGRPSAEGYAGFNLSNEQFPDGLTHKTYADDFLFESLASAVSNTGAGFFGFM